MTNKKFLFRDDRVHPGGFLSSNPFFKEKDRHLYQVGYGKSGCHYYHLSHSGCHDTQTSCIA